MKVVIQCAGQKSQCARRLRNSSGAEVMFVARPDLCQSDSSCPVQYCRPDDPIGPGLGTWRDAVVAYNQTAHNPNNLSTASDLYGRELYRELVREFGAGNVFILSAGWGMIRSDFLTPDYNITFSYQKKRPYARRAKRLTQPFKDLNHLAAAVNSSGEPVHFFGGSAYLPLLHALTQNLAANVIVHHKGKRPQYDGFSYEAFHGKQNQNWHYEAAKAFIASHKTR